MSPKSTQNSYLVDVGVRETRTILTLFTQSLNSPCSPSLIQRKSNKLPIHIPYERSLYDIKFERDRQNDLREKYNIPPPFQRKWLRQPRYIPQERPNFGQIQQP
ncbi:unnamed protein product [Rotaria sp. Silwood1]|nr:unnamed protein product [Rotaria sp. Silwood1]